MKNDIIPSVPNHKKIEKFFETLQKAAVPEKFTNSILNAIFQLKGTNDRPFITLLKALTFIDEKGVPLENYYDYKNTTQAPFVLGKCLKKGYEELYRMDENAHNLSEAEIKGHLMSLTGKESGNQALLWKVKTFVSLVNIAKFETKEHGIQVLEENTNESEPPFNIEDKPLPEPKKDFLLTHTVVVNVPTTTDKKVYDVLFKSIKENLL